MVQSNVNQVEKQTLKVAIVQNRRAQICDKRAVWISFNVRNKTASKNAELLARHLTAKTSVLVFAWMLWEEKMQTYDENVKTKATQWVFFV